MARMPPTDSVATGLAAAPRPLPVQRALFEIPDEVAYFNCASMAPQLAAARLAGEAALRRRAQPWLIRAEDWFTEAEERRTLFAQLAGVDADGVALVPASSYGLAVAAANLGAEPGRRVAVVAAPAVHWADGAAVDLAAVAERARAVGAALVVDASQSLGAMPLALAAIRPDYLVSVGYKWLLGPFSLAYLYVAERHRDGRPLEENWISRLGSDDL